MKGDKILSGDIEKHGETSCLGPFTFQVGVDQHEAAMLLQRIADTQARFMRSPLSPVANRLEQEVIMSSIFSANTIEGVTLSLALYELLRRSGEAISIVVTIP